MNTANEQTENDMSYVTLKEQQRVYQVSDLLEREFREHYLHLGSVYQC